MVAAGLLLLSRSFLDFSSSGLENPLTHLLLGIVLLVLYGDRWRAREADRVLALSLFASLVALTRPDAFLLVAPAVMVAAAAANRHGLLRAAAGMLPLVVWVAFSLFYYGSPLPNTALAKLGTGWDRTLLLRQGGQYLLAHLPFDPLALPLIGVGAALAWRRGGRHGRALALGVVAHLVYLAWIGGDFMAGRFLTPSLYLAAFALARWGGLASRRRGTVAVAVAVASLLLANVALLLRPTYDPQGLADERRVYQLHSSPLLAPIRKPWSEHRWRAEGERLRRAGVALTTHTNIGILGYFAGPGVHIVDELALADPLLARLPARRDAGQRPGHARRALPLGYLDSLRGDHNLIADPEIAALYERVRLATRAPLFDRRRIAAVAELLTRWLTGGR